MEEEIIRDPGSIAENLEIQLLQSCQTDPRTRAHPRVPHTYTYVHIHTPTHTNTHTQHTRVHKHDSSSLAVRDPYCTKRGRKDVVVAEGDIYKYKE
jgi:hypothetical protein